MNKSKTPDIYKTLNYSWHKHNLLKRIEYFKIGKINKKNAPGWV